MSVASNVRLPIFVDGSLTVQFVEYMPVALLRHLHYVTVIRLPNNTWVEKDDCRTNLPDGPPRLHEHGNHGGFLEAWGHSRSGHNTPN